VIVTERTPVLNISNYPDLNGVIAALHTFPRVHLVDAEGIAKEIRATRSSNMVLLGAASSFMPLSAEVLEAAINSIFARKGEKIVEQNIDAFRRGRAAVASQ
jgi:indolepyruvate ferredoxin oxidoreductase beta subunit